MGREHHIAGCILCLGLEGESVPHCWGCGVESGGQDQEDGGIGELVVINVIYILANLELIKT